MKVTFFNCQKSVYKYAFAALAFFFLFPVVVQAQHSLPPTPAWYYPIINSKIVERGDFSELKGKRRVYTSFFLSSSAADFGRTLERQVLEQLKQYEGLEVVDDPEKAEMAIHISLGFPFSFPQTQETSAPPLRDKNRKQDVEVYVLVRSKHLGNDIYHPRVIYRRMRMGREGDSTGVVLQIGSLISKLKKL